MPSSLPVKRWRGRSGKNVQRRDRELSHQKKRRHERPVHSGSVDGKKKRLEDKRKNGLGGRVGPDVV